MPQKKQSLDAMMADDLDSYSNSLQAMGNDEGYSLFPKSDYQHDGWEPFLPKNPLEGSRFEGIAISFQTRRRRLDHTRDKSTLHGNLDQFSRILSNRTLRTLARHGIAGDKTGMGSKSKGFVLVDEDDLEYVADIEPSKEQIRRFLLAERRRILNDTGLQKGDEHVKEEAEQDAGEAERLEEEDYCRAMKILAQIQASPGVIACCFVLTGTSSSMFYCPDLQKRNATIAIFRRTLAKAISVSTAEISINKIHNSTSGSLSESCDIEFTICTLSTADARHICKKIRELMSTDDFTNSVVRKGISVGYDLIQRAIGEPAADLMKSMARWAWQLSKNRLRREKILREREEERERQAAAKRAAERKQWSDDALDGVSGSAGATDQPSAPEAATLQTKMLAATVSGGPQSSSSQVTTPATIRPQSSSRHETTPATILPTPSETPALMPLLATLQENQLNQHFPGINPAILAPADTAGPLKPFKKKFKVGQGDTLEMSKASSFLTEFDGEYEPHGFKLQDPALRPATATNMRMHEYAKEQATHVFEKTRRAATVPPLPIIWTPKKRQLSSSYTLRLTSHGAPTSSIAQQDDTQANEHRNRLQEYFEANLRHRRCPQKGQMTEEARDELAVRKEARLEHLRLQREKEQQQLRELKQRLQAEKNAKNATSSRRRSKSPKKAKGGPPEGKEAQNKTEDGVELELQNERAPIRAAKADEELTRIRAAKAEASASLSRPASAKSVKSHHSTGLDQWAVDAAVDDVSMDESASMVNDPAPSAIGVQGDAPSSSLESSFDEGMGGGVQGERKPASRDRGLELVNEKQEERTSKAQAGARKVKKKDDDTIRSTAKTKTDTIRNTPKTKAGDEDTIRSTPKTKAGARKVKKKKQKHEDDDEGNDVDEFGACFYDESLHESSPKGHHIVISAASSKKGPAAKKKNLRRDKTSDSGSPLAPLVTAWTPQEQSPRSPTDGETVATGEQSSTALENQDSYESAGLDSTPPSSPIRGAFAAAMVAKRLGKKAKKAASKAETGKFKRKEQEVKEGDPAWHVAQIVKSSLHSADPNFAPIEANFRMENEQALMGGWSPDDTRHRDLRAKLVFIDAHGVKHCRMCENTRTMSIEDLSDAILKMMNAEVMPQSGEIDCPHCCGIMPHYRKAPLKLNKDRWKQEQDDWKPPIYNPEPGEELEIYHISELMERHKAMATASPRDIGITALEINSEEMSFCVADAQGQVAELDLASGDITGKYLEKSGSKVHCMCLVGDLMYMGLDHGVEEVKLAPTPQECRPRRKFVGQKAIFCLAASPDQRLLISGSNDCTTWVWDLRSGRVLSYFPPFDALIPPPLRLLASEMGATATRFSFAFRQHRDAVSCVAAFSGGMVTGSWDGAVCVSFLTGYKDRVDDQMLSPLVDKHLAPMRKSLKDLQQSIKEQRDAADRETNRKKNKLMISALKETEEQMAKLNEQIKALTNIEKTRMPRLKNLNLCRRFLYDARARGRVLNVMTTSIKTGVHMIFAAYSDSAVWQWDILSMAPVCVYLNYTAASLSSVTCDDVRLFTGYSDGTIKLWPIHQGPRERGGDKPKCKFTRRNFATLVGHSNHIIRLSTMSNLLVSASLDETVRVWDMATCLDYVYASLQAEDADFTDDMGENLSGHALSHTGSQRGNDAETAWAPSRAPHVSKTRSLASALSGPRSLGFMSPEAGSFRLGKTGSQKSQDTAFSYASGEGDLDPTLFTDSSYLQPVEPHADLLEMTSAVERLADRLTVTSLMGQEVLLNNRALLHPPKTKASAPKAK